MELDELKNELKNRLATDHTGRSGEDIASLLTGKTVSVTGKLKKSLWFEIISGTLAVFGLIYISLVTAHASIRIYFAVFAVLLMVFVVLLAYLLKRVQKLSTDALPVKGNLQAIVKTMEEFTRRYFQFTMALIPVCFVFAYILQYQENQRIPSFDHLAKTRFDTAWKVIAFVAFYFIVLGAGIWYFTKWYLKKLYGNYIAQLKECIGELDA